VEPAAVTPVPLRVCGGVSKTQIVLEAVWDSGETVAADEARNEGGAPQHVCNRADVDAGQALVAGRVIEHGHSSSLQTISFIEISIEAGILLGGKHEACFVLGVAGIEPMPSSLHDTVWRPLNGLKRAEIHQGHLLVSTAVPIVACRTQGAVEEELRAHIPHQTVPLQVEIGLDVERFHRVRIVGEGR
jgi:hypothetical protein